MPTTRSSRRSSEAFQTLEAPKRTSRNTRSRIVHPTSPRIQTQKEATVPVPEPEPLNLSSAAEPAACEHALAPSAILGITISPSIFTDQITTVPAITEPIGMSLRPTYVDASTQTEKTILLTSTKAADLEARPAANSNPKRARADDSDDEHQPKRIMLTPHEKSNSHLWMFSSTNSAIAPRSAPAKSMAPSSMRRNRGPLSRPPHHQRKTSNQPAAVHIPPRITPVDIDMSEKENHDTSKRIGNHTTKDEASESTPSPKPARAGLLGSLRGLAANSINFISHLSPIRPSSPAASPAKKQETTSDEFSPQKDGQHRSERERSDESPIEEDRDQSPDAFVDRSGPEHTTAGIYDHLHVYTPGNTPKQPLTSVPRAPPPVDPYQQLKKQHPNMPDAYLRRVADRRIKERVARNLALGLPAEGPLAVIAPLFGPDSHYARGTIDPRTLLEKPHTSIDYQLRCDLAKRKHDEVEGDHLSEDQSSMEREPTRDSGRTATVEDDPDDPFLDTPTAKRQRIMPPSTPRSALKKNTDFSASVGRSGRSVLFNTNPVSGSRDLRAHYGPAGQYRGSTFADKSPPSSREPSTLSTFDESDVISPLTRNNTNLNSAIPSGRDAMVQLEKNLGADIPDIDFTVRDPRDPNWRPSIGHPRPSTFCVPDFDDDDEDFLDEDNTISVTPAGQTKGSSESAHPSRSTQQSKLPDPSTPAQPSAPRMSHAELPSASSSLPSDLSTGTIIGSTPNNDANNPAEPTESAIERVRSAAQKYKPKDASRLSEVSTRPRSPSPEDDLTPRSSRTTATPTPAPPSSKPTPFIPAPLNDTIVGPDGLTDHGREHQFDAWAASLDWGVPQTYEEAGIRTAEIGELIRRHWGSEDDRRSEQFWHREFEDIEREQERAKARGRRLEFVTGMEDEVMA